MSDFLQKKKWKKNFLHDKKKLAETFFKGTTHLLLVLTARLEFYNALAWYTKRKFQWYTGTWTQDLRRESPVSWSLHLTPSCHYKYNFLLWIYVLLPQTITNRHGQALQIQLTFFPQLMKLPFSSYFTALIQSSILHTFVHIFGK